MDRHWQTQGRRSFQVGMGINSGDVIAGDAGFHDRRVFTVVGPETLFAARLQELTIDLNASIVASATTCNPVRDRFSLLPLTGHPLPGLKRLSDAFIVLGLPAESGSLQMPGSSAFRETKVDAAVRKIPAGTNDASPAAGTRAAKRVGRVTPAPPEIVPLARLDIADPLAVLRRRAELAADTAFGVPAPRESEVGEGTPDAPIRPKSPLRLPPDARP
jgi:hypothetical protein